MADINEIIIQAEFTSDDYYVNLGVDKKASAVEIKKAYRKLAILHHPDKNLQEKEKAEEIFKVVGEAYAVLGDKEKREIYDTHGKGALEEGMEPMTRERARRIFDNFFRFGDEFDPDAPDSNKGFQRAAGGAVYAPLKGIVYGARSVLTGVVMGTASVVVGAGAMVGNIALGFKEMGEAGVSVIKCDKDKTSTPEESTGASSTTSETSSLSTKPPPTFINGLKRATIGAVIAPVTGILAGGGVLLASGVAAGGYVVGGIAGAATNVSSGVREIKAAKRKKQADSIVSISNID